MKNLIKDYSLLILGSIILSFGTVAFLVPYNFGTGGVTGIALCLNKMFNLKIGLMTIIMNIPLFLFGFKLLGKTFGIRSGFVVLFSSIVLDFLNANLKITPMDDKLLAAVIFGLLMGISMYIILLASGSTGGLDISAKIFCNKFDFLQLSNIMLIQDIVVYILLAFVMGPKSVLYALIISYIRTKAIDGIQEGIASSKQCVIICQNSELMIHEIKDKLSRGVTVLDAVGGYSNDNKKFIYLVIQKQQLSTLKFIVNSLEPNAFVTISPVSNILGNYKQALSVQ